MADAMHEVLLEGGIVRVLFLDGSSAQELQIDQFLFDQSFGFLLPILPKFARLQVLARLAEDAEHRVVNLFLTRRELSTHRNRAREVGIVIRKTCRDIEQEQIALSAV